MNAAGDILRDEIRRGGPVPFSRFMEVALYHPGCGYYTSPVDPFGKAGDFYTAEQVQPVFGTLIAAYLRQLRAELGDPGDFTVVELGAGRGEMTEAMGEFHYIPVDIGRGQLPERFAGVVFSNEFFDALPVDVYTRIGGEWIERRVDWRDGRFVWTGAGRANGDAECYLLEYGPPDAEEGTVVEVNLAAISSIAQVGRALERGFVLTIDYGYTTRELVRFPRGTLMSYRRHRALDDVLEEPGSRDITAHAPFSAIEDAGRRAGLDLVRRETLARTLLRAGEADQFAAALAAGTDQEEKRRMQLKTLLFGMGETFMTLLQRKLGPK